MISHSYFRGNEIEVLPPDFSKLNRLELFDASENRLASVDKVCCATTTKKILTIIQVDIRTFTSLTDINVSNNKLRFLFRGIGGCRVLKNVDASKNLLEKFPRGTIV